MTPILVTGQMPEISLLPAVLTVRDVAVDRARQITAVVTVQDKIAAVEAASELRGIENAYEAGRVLVTTPMRKEVERINDLIWQAKEPVTPERKRLERLVALFDQQERERIAKEEQARQVEIQKLEADRKAKQAELDKATANMATEQDLDLAIQRERELNTAAAVSYQRIVELPKGTKVRGSSSGLVAQYEVTDIWALAKARPELVNIEPKMSAIRALVFPGMVVPGLRVWEESRAVVKAGKVVGAWQ